MPQLKLPRPEAVLRNTGQHRDAQPRPARKRALLAAPRGSLRGRPAQPEIDE